MGRPRSPNKRTTKIAAPASDDEKEAWERACAKVEMEPADTLRKLALAFIAQVDTYGYVVNPIRFAPPKKK